VYFTVVQYYITTLRIHKDPTADIQTTRISAELAALGIALMLNFAMMGAIAYLFDAQAGYGLTPRVHLAAV
jgi:hypothetical protein